MTKDQQKMTPSDCFKSVAVIHKDELNSLKVQLADARTRAILAISMLDDLRNSEFIDPETYKTFARSVRKLIEPVASLKNPSGSSLPDSKG